MLSNDLIMQSGSIFDIVSYSHILMTAFLAFYDLMRTILLNQMSIAVFWTTSPARWIMLDN